MARYGIDCDLKDGNVFAAFTAKQMRELEAKQALWRRPRASTTSRCSTGTGSGGTWRATPISGGCSTAPAGTCIPLNLALGEAAALERLGGVIHEASPVVAIEDVGGRPVVRTAAATVRPQALILAGNAYLGHVVPELENRVMPFSTQIIATEPLGERGRALLPTDVCVEDVRYVLDYYRLSADGRLLCGGGTVYGGTDPADIRAKLVPNLERVFPQLEGVGIDFAWSGNCAISFSRVPQLGRLGRAHLFRAGLQRPRGGRQPPLRADPRRGGARRPGSLRRVRERALDPVSGRAALRGALFRARIVVVWVARPARGLMD